MAALAFTTMFAAGGFTAAAAAGALAAVTATFLGSMLAGAIYGAVTGDAEGGRKFAEGVFNFSAGFLVANVLLAELFGGGVASTGASGPFQGYVASNNSLLGEGLTLGTSSGTYGSFRSELLAHEYGHTLQFFVITAAAPKSASQLYLAGGISGILFGPTSWFESTADTLGGL